MREFFRLFLLVVFIISFPSFSSGLTLPDALAMAEQHPVLKLHDLNIAGRQYEIIDTSAKGPDSLSITTENFGGKSGFSDLETTIEVSMPLQNSRRVKARKKLAEARVSLSRVEKETARWMILSQTTRAFHKALVINGLTEKARENIENSEKLLEASKIMVEAGSVAEQEVFQAELVLAQAKLELQSMLGLQADAKVDLIAAMGLESLAEIDVVGSVTAELELPAVEELESIIFKSHPEIVTRQLDATQTQARLDLIRAENTPTWNITAGARNSRETGTNDFLIGFSAELPRARDNKGERAALKKDLERISLEQKNSERELRLKLQSAWQRFNRLQDQTRRLRDEILPGAYHLFELSLTGYQLGKTDQIVVLQAQKEFLGQKENYLQHLEELYEAASSIESLAGVSGSYSFTHPSAE